MPDLVVMLLWEVSVISSVWARERRPGLNTAAAVGHQADPERQL